MRRSSSSPQPWRSYVRAQRSPGAGDRAAELVAEGHVCGQPWVVDITVFGTAGNPALCCLRPAVTIQQGRALRSHERGARKSLTFRARPTGRAGVYRARVVFPNAGTWRYEVYDAFTEYGGARTHTFAPVKITLGRT